MSGNTLGILNLRVAGDFVMAGSPRVRFGRLDERSADALTLRFRLYIPALDERDR